jgi:glycosyltransferase involved in cell wall biosynthesis
MGKPLTFSVGVPTFNQAEFLGETIESLLHQTRPPDEIVVSDHYSTDNTLDVVARYRGHVRLVQPPPGTNLTGQYNFTLSSQSCDWITLLSSDDVALPCYVETLMRGAASRDDAALVRAGWENIDAVGQTVGVNYMLRSPKLELPPATLLSQRHGPKVSFAAFAVRRTAYERSGPILASLESLADWALFVQLAPFGAFVYEDVLVSSYRVGHDGNKFRKRVGMWIRDEVRIFDEVMPLAAERAGMADRTWIGEASRANFLRYLASASREFQPDTRAEIVPLFETWAARVGGQRELQRFAAGETVTAPLSLLERGKRLVRPLAQQLYAKVNRQ